MKELVKGGGFDSAGTCRQVSVDVAPPVQGRSRVDIRVLPLWFSFSLLAIILHALVIALPSVNLEFAFAEGSRFFLAGDRRFLDLYCYYQANTLGVPYLIHQVARLGISPGLAARVIALSGIPLLAYATVQLKKAVDAEISETVLLSVALFNPFAFVFAARGTADFFPAALSLFGAALLFRDEKISTYVLGGLIIGVASVLKYHAILLGPMVFLALYRKNLLGRDGLMRLLGFAVPVAVPVTLYLVHIHRDFHFWILPRIYQTTHTLDVRHFLDNLVSYCGNMVVLSAPFSLAHWINGWRPRAFLIRVGIASVLFTAGYHLLSNTGEITFGPLSAVVSDKVVFGMFAVLAVCFLAEGLAQVRRVLTGVESQGNRKLIGLGGVLALALIALCLTRPSSRYLLFILPLYLLLIPRTSFEKPFLKYLWIGLVVLSNSYVAASQYYTGIAARQMMTYIAGHSLEPATDLGIIERHVGNIELFQTLEDPKSYLVINGTNGLDGKGQLIHTVRSGYPPYLGKTYSLVSLPESHQQAANSTRQ